MHKGPEKDLRRLATKEKTLPQRYVAAFLPIGQLKFYLVVSCLDGQARSG